MQLSNEMYISIKPHSLFYENYLTVDRLGGAFGDVYKCQHLKTPEIRAVKIVIGAQCCDMIWCNDRETFVPSEIFLWERCSHENILQLLEIYFDSKSDRWFMVMEYLPGYVDLFDYVSKTGALSDRDSAVIIRQLIRVVWYLIHNKIDHRDIKDENLLYNPSTGSIKLIDFGVSETFVLKAYTTIKGTEVYIPPERYISGSYSPICNCLEYRMSYLYSDLRILPL